MAFYIHRKSRKTLNVIEILSLLNYFVLFMNINADASAPCPNLDK